jgi:hypothetical protein
MRTGWLFSVLIVLTLPSFAAPSLPDTSAGRAFRAWLDAFNSGDSEREAAYFKTYEPSSNSDSMTKWRAETGPYDLLEVYSGDDRNVFFRIKARADGTEEVGRLRVSDFEPVVVQALETSRIPVGVDVALDVVVLDKSSRRTIVEHVADVFERFYVLPEVAKKIASDLRTREKRNEYRSIKYGMDLARKLTQDVQAISHDGHASVRFSYFQLPAEPSSSGSQADLRRLARVNCGFTKAEHLRPNLGYIKLDGFEDVNLCAPTASAALAFVASSDALILDLRDNHGGGGGMVEFVAGYLFSDRTHLNDRVGRGETKREEAWTVADVPGKKFLDKPVFILTSNQTFSAAEAFSYALKNLKRAILVGETTGGGAHMIETKLIDEHFSAIVPIKQSLNPITNTNWEGVGVEPNVKVSADQALDTAISLASEQLHKGQY